MGCGSPPVSNLMNYGPDWPPAPNPAPGAALRRPDPARMTLGQRCLATVVLTAIAWGTGALVLHAIDPAPHTTVPVVVWHDARPARGHTTDVTASLPPDPAISRRNPGQ
jgi:hypothetical protein